MIEDDDDDNNTIKQLDEVMANISLLYSLFFYYFLNNL
jgi:hypothetical protein